MAENELSQEELDAQTGEHLPDREAMSVLDPGPLAGGVHDLELPNQYESLGTDDPEPSPDIYTT